MTKEEKRIREQIQNIADRIEFIAETEPSILNILQRMVEGLSIIDNETISRNDNGLSKISTMRRVGRLKTNKCINGVNRITKAFEKIDIETVSK